MNGYLSDNSYSRSRSGGYLDGLQTPNFDAIFGSGQSKGSTNGDFGNYGLVRHIGTILPGRPTLSGLEQGANNLQETQLAQKLAPMRAQADIQSQQMKQQAMLDWEMFKAKLAASESESMRQREAMQQGYLNNLGQRRYNTYLGYGI